MNMLYNPPLFSCKPKIIGYVNLPLKQQSFFIIMGISMANKALPPVRSRLGAFAQRLARGEGVSADPFDEDYFNLADHLAIKEEEILTLSPEQLAIYRQKEKEAREINEARRWRYFENQRRTDGDE